MILMTHQVRQIIINSTIIEIDQMLILLMMNHALTIHIIANQRTHRVNPLMTLIQVRDDGHTMRANGIGK
jgi:hypothetical protein